VHGVARLGHVIITACSHVNWSPRCSKEYSPIAYHIIPKNITELLLRMLNLMNDPISIGSGPEEADDASAWKILVLDAVGQAILSPILKVNELREAGVTLYLYK